MNQKTFDELITNSHLLNKETLSELEQLLKEYPFCQTFHLLYTKNLYQQKHLRYHQQLKVAAAVVGERSRLKHYIEDVNEEANVDSEVLTPTFITPDQNIIPEVIQQEEEHSQPVANEEWDPEFDTILLSSLDTNISREEKKKAIIALINKKFSEQTVIAQEIHTDVLAEVPTKTMINPEEISVNFEHDSFKEMVSDSENKEVIASNILIENFIRNAPRMPRPKKEFYNAANLAARSIEENEDFYTETYASICLKQGNVSKAIKIYDKLSLKLPEKSSYFAALIEKIKREQNI